MARREDLMLPALGGKLSPSKSSSTNPFDNESEGEEPLSPLGAADPAESELTDSVTENSSQNDEPRYTMRGGLISGNVIDAEEEVRRKDGKDDVESGSWPPDSDYASRAPKSIWETASIVGDTNTKNPIQPEIAERPFQSKLPSFFNRDKPMSRRRYLRILLGVAMVVMLLAIIAVVLIIRASKEDRQVSRDARQRALDDIIETASTPEALAEKDSPQYRARKWLLLDDDLLLDPRDDDTTEAQVIQRYSLAVFYFAAGGAATWGENNWLEGGECDGHFWHYIKCNENKEVQAMVFGK